MPAISRTKASLRLRGGDLDPAELTQLFGVEPTDAAPKGGVQHFGGGRTRLAPTGYWHLTSPLPLESELSGHLSWILNAVTSDLVVWHGLARYSPNIFVGLFLDDTNEGLEIDADMLKAISDRGIGLGLDIYGAIDGSGWSSLADGLPPEIP